MSGETPHVNGLASASILGDETQVAQASAIVADLAKGFHSSEEVFAAFESLDALDPDIVRAALLQWTGVSSDPDSLDDATRRAHGLPPRRLRLRTTRIVRDADLLDLGPVVEEQVRVAGRSYDGLDLSAEERLDGEREDVSFAGSLALRTLADEEAPNRPLFDVLHLTDDAGLVFRAGTAEIVGTIAYGTVEIADRQAREAIQRALSEPPPPEAEMVALEAFDQEEPHPDTLVVVEVPSVEPPAHHDPSQERRQLALFEGDDAAPTPKLPPREGAPVAGVRAPKTARVAKKTSAKRIVARTKTSRASKSDGIEAKISAKKGTRLKQGEASESTAKPATKRASAESAPKKASAKKASAKKASTKKASTKTAKTSVKKTSAKAATKKASSQKVTSKKKTSTKASAATSPTEPSTTPTKKRAARAKGDESATASSSAKKRKAVKQATKKGAQQKSPGSKAG